MAEATETTEEETTDVVEATTEEETVEETLTAEEAKALRDENNRLKRERADAAKKAKDAERAARAAAEEKAKKDGNWQKVAEEKEREAEEARKEAEEARDKLAKSERSQRVRSIATRLNFRNPDIAVALLTGDEADDDKLAEAALKRLARSDKYLVDEQRRSGGDLNGNSGGLTPEQEHQETLKQLFGG